MVVVILLPREGVDVIEMRLEMPREGADAVEMRSEMTGEDRMSSLEVAAMIRDVRDGIEAATSSDRYFRREIRDKRGRRVIKRSAESLRWGKGGGEV